MTEHVSTQNDGTVGNLSLKNAGGFTVKLGVVINGKRADKETGSYPLGQTETLNPGDCGANNGDTVQVYADVALGKDKTSSQKFTYAPGTNLTAYFVISGTTLDDDLGFIDIH